VVGVLYVSYDIDLMTPVLNPAPSLPGQELYTSSLVVSNSTGGAYDNEVDLPNSGWQRVYWAPENFAPSASTVYRTVGTMPTQQTTSFYSATLSESAKWRLVGQQPVLDIFRNGAYYLRIRMSYGSTAGQNKALTNPFVTQTPATLTASGSAAVSSDVLDAAVPAFFSKTTDTQSVADLFYTFNVSGITTPDDFVTFTPGSYVTTDNSLFGYALPGSLATNITMAWTSIALASATKITAP
jgi:hypothetical protein